jgi:hypothetical protein
MMKCGKVHGPWATGPLPKRIFVAACHAIDQDVQTVQSIEEAFQAQSIVQYQGKPVVLGPDHYARLTSGRW